MTTPTYYDLVRCYMTTTGVGSMTIGRKVPGYRTPTEASIPSGTTIRYKLLSGLDWEIGEGTLTNLVLARVTVNFSSNSGSKIEVGLNAIFEIIFSAEDMNDVLAAAGSVVAAEGYAIAAAASAAAAAASAASVPTVSIDGTFAANSDALVPSQKAAKTYVDLRALKSSNLSDLAQKYTGLDNLSVHGADIVGAATTNLETATGFLVDVTGAVAITAITLSEGHERVVRFTGALVLTNGASLVLPGGANITTAAGDYAIFVGYAAGVVRCIDYVRAAGRTLNTAVSDTITVGYKVTPFSGGTVSSGTITPDPATGNYQYYTNGGAHTLAAPSSDCSMDILITNNASAGAITFSGFTVGSSPGSALTTTNTNKFIVSIRRVNSVSTYSIYALQ